MKSLHLSSFESVKGDDGKTYSPKIKSLTSEHVNEIYDLQSKVTDGLDNKTLYQFQSYEDIKYIIEEGNIGVGMWAENRLIGYCYCFIPMHNKNNIGLDMHLPLEERLKVVHIERCVVDMGFRAKGIQTFLMEQVFHLLNGLTTKLGHKIRYIYSKTNPLNEPILKVLLKNNMKIVNLVQEDKKMEYIFYLDLENPWNNADFHIKIEVKPNNYSMQQEVFQHNYIGVNYRTRDDELLIRYGFIPRLE